MNVCQYCKAPIGEGEKVCENCAKKIEILFDTEEVIEKFNIRYTIWNLSLCTFLVLSALTAILAIVGFYNNLSNIFCFITIGLYTLNIIASLVCEIFRYKFKDKILKRIDELMSE